MLPSPETPKKGPEKEKPLTDAKSAANLEQLMDARDGQKEKVTIDTHEKLITLLKQTLESDRGERKTA